MKLLVCLIPFIPTHFKQWIIFFDFLFLESGEIIYLAGLSAEILLARMR